MNAVELAKLFTEYAETKVRLENLETQIKAEVLKIGKSQAIAGVKATYYNESAEYDYFGAAKSMNPTIEVIDHFTVTTSSTVTKWKELAEAIGANLDRFKTVKPPRVVVK